jgi:hypothetical protein
MFMVFWIHRIVIFTVDGPTAMFSVAQKFVINMSTSDIALFVEHHDILKSMASNAKAQQKHSKLDIE